MNDCIETTRDFEFQVRFGSGFLGFEFRDIEAVLVFLNFDLGLVRIFLGFGSVFGLYRNPNVFCSAKFRLFPSFLRLFQVFF